MVVARGELWWGEAPDSQGRPYLVVSRQAAIEVMQRVLVAPSRRGCGVCPASSPWDLTRVLPRAGAASFDILQPYAKAMLTRRLGALGSVRLHEICRVAGATLDC